MAHQKSNMDWCPSSPEASSIALRPAPQPARDAENPPPVGCATSAHESKGKNKRPASDMGVEPPIDNATLQASRPQIVFRVKDRLPYDAPIWNDDLSLDTFASAVADVPKATFNTYKAILRHPNLFFQFTVRLPPHEFLQLYCIDKEFHWRCNKYNSSIIYEHAVYHAPVAANIFAPRLFPHLCISDPVLKPMNKRDHLARDIPSLRWVKMVMHRELVVRHVLTLLALDGHLFPRSMKAVLMKFWCLMETCTIAGRKAQLESSETWSDTDLQLFQLFWMKLDMRFSDPVISLGDCALSRMCLKFKTPAYLRDVLLGEELTTYRQAHVSAMRAFNVAEMITAIVEEWIDLETTEEEGFTALGQPHGWQWLSQENFDQLGVTMQPAYEMVLDECVARGYDPRAWAFDFMLYGVFEPSGEITRKPMLRTETEWWYAEGRWPQEEEREAEFERFKTKLVNKGVRQEMMPERMEMINGVVSVPWSLLQQIREMAYI